MRRGEKYDDHLGVLKEPSQRRENQAFSGDDEKNSPSVVVDPLVLLQRLDQPQAVWDPQLYAPAPCYRNKSLYAGPEQQKKPETSVGEANDNAASSNLWILTANQRQPKAAASASRHNSTEEGEHSLDAVADASFHLQARGRGHFTPAAPHLGTFKKEALPETIPTTSSQDVITGTMRRQRASDASGHRPSMSMEVLEAAFLSLMERVRDAHCEADYRTLSQILKCLKDHPMVTSLLTSLLALDTVARDTFDRILLQTAEDFAQRLVAQCADLGLDPFTPTPICVKNCVGSFDSARTTGTHHTAGDQKQLWTHSRTGQQTFTDLPGRPGKLHKLPTGTIPDRFSGVGFTTRGRSAAAATGSPSPPLSATHTVPSQHMAIGANNATMSLSPSSCSPPKEGRSLPQLWKPLRSWTNSLRFSSWLDNTPRRRGSTSPNLISDSQAHDNERPQKKATVAAAAFIEPHDSAPASDGVLQACPFSRGSSLVAFLCKGDEVLFSPTGSTARQWGSLGCAPLTFSGSAAYTARLRQSLITPPSMAETPGSNTCPYTPRDLQGSAIFGFKLEAMAQQQQPPLPLLDSASNMGLPQASLQCGGDFADCGLHDGVPSQFREEGASSSFRSRLYSSSRSSSSFKGCCCAPHVSLPPRYWTVLSYLQVVGDLMAEHNLDFAVHLSCHQPFIEALASMILNCMAFYSAVYFGQRARKAAARALYRRHLTDGEKSGSLSYSCPPQDCHCPYVSGSHGTRVLCQSARPYLQEQKKLLQQPGAYETSVSFQEPLCSGLGSATSPGIMPEYPVLSHINSFQKTAQANETPPPSFQVNAEAAPQPSQLLLRHATRRNSFPTSSLQRSVVVQKRKSLDNCCVGSFEHSTATRAPSQHALSSFDDFHLKRTRNIVNPNNGVRDPSFRRFTSTPQTFSPCSDPASPSTWTSLGFGDARLAHPETPRNESQRLSNEESQDAFATETPSHRHVPHYVSSSFRRRRGDREDRELGSKKKPVTLREDTPCSRSRAVMRTASEPPKSFFRHFFLCCDTGHESDFLEEAFARRPSKLSTLSSCSSSSSSAKARHAGHEFSSRGPCTSVYDSEEERMLERFSVASSGCFEGNHKSSRNYARRFSKPLNSDNGLRRPVKESPRKHTSPLYNTSEKPPASSTQHNYSPLHTEKTIMHYHDPLHDTEKGASQSVPPLLPTTSNDVPDDPSPSLVDVTPVTLGQLPSDPSPPKTFRFPLPSSSHEHDHGSIHCPSFASDSSQSLSENIFFSSQTLYGMVPRVAAGLSFINRSSYSWSSGKQVSYTVPVLGAAFPVARHSSALLNPRSALRATPGASGMSSSTESSAFHACSSPLSSRSSAATTSPSYTSSSASLYTTPGTYPFDPGFGEDSTNVPRKLGSRRCTSLSFLQSTRIEMMSFLPKCMELFIFGPLFTELSQVPDASQKFLLIFEYFAEARECRPFLFRSCLTLLHAIQQNPNLFRLVASSVQLASACLRVLHRLILTFISGSRHRTVEARGSPLTTNSYLQYTSSDRGGSNRRDNPNQRIVVGDMARGTYIEDEENNEDDGPDFPASGFRTPESETFRHDGFWRPLSPGTTLSVGLKALRRRRLHHPISDKTSKRKGLSKWCIPTTTRDKRNTHHVLCTARASPSSHPITPHPVRTSPKGLPSQTKRLPSAPFSPSSSHHPLHYDYADDADDDAPSVSSLGSPAPSKRHPSHHRRSLSSITRIQHSLTSTNRRRKAPRTRRRGFIFWSRVRPWFNNTWATLQHKREKRRSMRHASEIARQTGHRQHLSSVLASRPRKRRSEITHQGQPHRRSNRCNPSDATSIFSCHASPPQRLSTLGPRLSSTTNVLPTSPRFKFLHKMMPSPLPRLLCRWKAKHHPERHRSASRKPSSFPTQKETVLLLPSAPAAQDGPTWHSADSPRSKTAAHRHRRPVDQRTDCSKKATRNSDIHVRHLNSSDGILDLGHWGGDACPPHGMVGSGHNSGGTSFFPPQVASSCTGDDEHVTRPHCVDRAKTDPISSPRRRLSSSGLLAGGEEELSPRKAPPRRYASTPCILSSTSHATLKSLAHEIHYLASTLLPRLACSCRYHAFHITDEHTRPAHYGIHLEGLVTLARNGKRGRLLRGMLTTCNYPGIVALRQSKELVCDIIKGLHRMYPHHHSSLENYGPQTFSVVTNSTLTSRILGPTLTGSKPHQSSYIPSDLEYCEGLLSLESIGLVNRGVQASSSKHVRKNCLAFCRCATCGIRCCVAGSSRPSPPLTSFPLSSRKLSSFTLRSSRRQRHGTGEGSLHFLGGAVFANAAAAAVASGGSPEHSGSVSAPYGVVCSKCQTTRYCSVACRQIHSSLHRHMCGQLAAFFALYAENH